MTPPEETGGNSEHKPQPNFERYLSTRPNPDIEPAARANDFQTVELETLVRMKLNAFRRKDQVHLLDMILLGMIDTSWLSKFPEPLRARLEELLNDPDG